jgi:Family of unknown function (DUF6165)
LALFVSLALVIFQLERKAVALNVNEIRVPVSAGEMLDKIAILEIKLERIADPAKQHNIRVELDALMGVWRQIDPQQAAVEAERAALKAINEKLWVIEDDIRDLERAQQFDARFIELARAVYFTNDERARIKRVLNGLLGSLLVEEKSYADYRA